MLRRQQRNSRTLGTTNALQCTGGGGCLDARAKRGAGSVSADPRGVHVGPVLEQKLHDARVPALAGNPQWGRSVHLGTHSGTAAPRRSRITASAIAGALGHRGLVILCVIRSTPTHAHASTRTRRMQPIPRPPLQYEGCIQRLAAPQERQRGPQHKQSTPGTPCRAVQHKHNNKRDCAAW